MEHPIEDEYAIYAAVLNELSSRWPNLKLYIQPRTLSFRCGKDSCNTFQVGDGCSGMRTRDQNSKDVLDGLRDSFKGLQGTTIDDFDKKNTNCSLLENRFPAEHDYLWTGEDNKYAIGKRALDDIPEEWRDSDFIYFSRVGFDPKKQQALLYWGLVCHEKCSWIGWYFLTKQNSEWRLDNNLQVLQIARD